MELRNIRTFIQVAKLGNFSRAARDLGYAQSTVTAQIQQLESELNTSLFERNGKIVSLSEAGKKFLDYAYLICRYEQEAEEYFQQEKEPEGTLRIGIMETLCASGYAQLFYRYGQLYDKVKLKLQVCTTWEAMELLEKGKLDVILTLDQKICRDEWITAMEIMEDVSFFCSVSHPFATRKKVSVEELLEEPFIFIEEGCNYRQVFEQDMQKQGKKVQCKMEVGHTQMIIDGVAGQMGISLLPNFTLHKALLGREICVIPVEGYRIKMAIQVIYDKNRFVMPALRAFLDFLPQGLDKSAAAP